MGGKGRWKHRTAVSWGGRGEMERLHSSFVCLKDKVSGGSWSVCVCACVSRWNPWYSWKALIDGPNALIGHETWGRHAPSSVRVSIYKHVLMCVCEPPCLHHVCGGIDLPTRSVPSQLVEISHRRESSPFRQARSILLTNAPATNGLWAR